MPASPPVTAVQRRLAAIFSADVAGYTRLMNTDEGGTLRLLTSHREVADRLIAHHGGRIANTAGDSILAEFPSVVDALSALSESRKEVAAVNDEVPEERRVSLHGVHVGEAMVVRGGLVWRCGEHHCADTGLSQAGVGMFVRRGL
jgi:class 3 adenylate cyclase